MADISRQGVREKKYCSPLSLVCKGTCLSTIHIHGWFGGMRETRERGAKVSTDTRSCAHALLSVIEKCHTMSSCEGILVFMWRFSTLSLQAPPWETKWEKTIGPQAVESEEQFINTKNLPLALKISSSIDPHVLIWKDLRDALSETWKVRDICIVCFLLRKWNIHIPQLLSCCVNTNASSLSRWKKYMKSETWVSF